MANTKDTGGRGPADPHHRDRPEPYTFDSGVVTGKQIKEKPGIPAGFRLHCRVKGGNERIPDDESVELHSGDHFFSRPPSNLS